MADEEQPAHSTHEAGCHCGYIKFAVTLLPPLHEQKVLTCSCSMCRRAGYLLVYPDRDQVTWHGDSRERCAIYQFNTKQKDQLFCPKCGASLGIDFRDFHKPKWDGYGISIRTFNDMDLDTVQYRKLEGVTKVEPSEDLSGKQWELDEAERRVKGEAI